MDALVISDSLILGQIAVELPFVDVYVEDCPSLVLWQHGGYQASRADTTHSSPHGGASERGQSASLASGLVVMYIDFTCM